MLAAVKQKNSYLTTDLLFLFTWITQHIGTIYSLLRPLKAIMWFTKKNWTS